MEKITKMLIRRRRRRRSRKKVNKFIGKEMKGEKLTEQRTFRALV